MTEPKWVLAVIKSVPEKEDSYLIGKAIWIENDEPHYAPEEQAFDSLHREWKAAESEPVYFTYVKALQWTKYKQIQIPSARVELLPVYKEHVDLVSLQEWLDDKTDPSSLL